ncbi:Alpha/Beta hydrolase protein [Thermothelomyces heterothallicus CBS 202.75]|uniref:Alpha/Beta hydrolase protein n=1 Tax=Thermothelomyces heterothallicus CBS 202.75 TaxID=1149848 RepID=UPI003743CF93
MSTTAAPARDLPVITIPPSPPHPHTHTIIFLHGRGDNIKSFSRALRKWHSSRGTTLFDTFPTLRWVFPQAPMRQVASTANLPRPHIFPQWFDLWTAQDFSEREEVQVEGLRESVPLIRDMIAREAAQLGGRWDRVILAGISMGGATSVHTLFNLDIPAEGGGRLAALLGFCARCPFAGRSLQGMREVLALPGSPPAGENGVLRRTPVLLEHSADDPLVLIDNGRRLRDTLKGFGAQVEWREYITGGHWFQEPEGIDDAIEFLEKIVFGVNAGEQTRAAADPVAMDLS